MDWRGKSKGCAFKTIIFYITVFVCTCLQSISSGHLDRVDAGGGTVLRMKIFVCMKCSPYLVQLQQTTNNYLVIFVSGPGWPPQCQHPDNQWQLSKILFQPEIILINVKIITRFMSTVKLVISELDLIPQI